MRAARLTIQSWRPLAVLDAQSSGADVHLPPRPRSCDNVKLLLYKSKDSPFD